eukprot:CAMPEP_0194343862 /NCGR_PEP_ID=MMETSP0171-20130528/98965_1 /TAXON_ID=218684 /ORGANISM="Corethron pennatum, Strain L29A3" /LENGTH=130 /DNA_ID=CAMNT_0039110291 /DNA_START=428 /DNA_END=817 /DNA_ORIENTATION=-
MSEKIKYLGEREGEEEEVTRKQEKEKQEEVSDVPKYHSFDILSDNAISNNETLYSSVEDFSAKHAPVADISNIPDSNSVPNDDVSKPKDKHSDPDAELDSEPLNDDEAAAPDDLVHAHVPDLVTPITNTS